MEGRNAAGAFANLLRRSIPPSKLVETCVAEWKGSFLPDPQTTAALEAAPARASKPIDAYREVAATLHARRSLPLQRTKPLTTPHL